MAFIKNGDAETIKIIKETKLNDQETAQALKELRQVSKNLNQNGNNIESNQETSDKL